MGATQHVCQTHGPLFDLSRPVPESLAVLIISSSPALPRPALPRPALPRPHILRRSSASFHPPRPGPPSYLQETGIWVADESVSMPLAVAVSDLVRVVPAEYGQRQVRGPSNPHGEHAHDIWQVGV